MTEPKATMGHALLALLRDKGLLSAESIAQHLGWTKKQALMAISRERMAHPKASIRVAGYAPRSSKGPAVFLYAAQAGEDAPRPVLSEEEKLDRKRILQGRRKPAAEPTATRPSGVRDDERLVIPEHQRPHCTGTSTGRYTGAELSYRGRA